MTARWPWGYGLTHHSYDARKPFLGGAAATVHVLSHDWATGPQQPVPTRHIFVSQISLHPTSNKHVFFSGGASHLFLDIPSFSSSTSRTSLSFSLSENSIYNKVTLCISFYSLDSRRRLDGRRNWQLYPINMGSNCLHLLNHHHCHLLLRQTPTWLSAQGNFSASHA